MKVSNVIKKEETGSRRKLIKLGDDSDNVVVIKLWNDLVDRVEVPAETEVVVTCIELASWNGKIEGNTTPSTKFVASNVRNNLELIVFKHLLYD